MAIVDDILASTQSGDKVIQQPASGALPTAQTLQTTAPDLNIVRENVKKMIDQNAPDHEIGGYLESLKLSPEDLKQEVMPTVNARPTGIQSAPNSPPWVKKARDILASVEPSAQIVGNMGSQALTSTALSTAATQGVSSLATRNPLLAMVAAGTLTYAGIQSLYNMADNYLAKIEYGAPIKGLEDPSVLQGFKQGLINLKDGLMFELGGRSVGGLTEKTLGAFTQGAKTPLAQDAADLGMRVTPAEAGGKRISKITESVLNAHPTSSDIMADYRFQNQLEPLMKIRENLIGSGASEKEILATGNKIYNEVTQYLTDIGNVRSSAVNDIRTQILSSMGSNFTPESVGLTGKEAIKMAEAGARQRVSNAYLVAGENIGFDTPIPTPNLSRISQENLNLRATLPGQPRTLLSRLNWGIDEAGQASSENTILDTLRQMYPNASDDFLQKNLQNFTSQLQAEAPAISSKIKTWPMLVAMDQDLGSLVRSNNPMKDQSGIVQLSSESRIYSQMQKALQQDMENYVTSIGGDAFNQYQFAKALYNTEVSSVFKTDVIKAAYNANPEDVISAAFVPNGITELKTVRTALKNNPKAFSNLQAGFTNQLLGLNMSEDFNPKFLSKQLNRFGEPMLAELYGPEGYASLRRAADIGTSALLESKTAGEAYLKNLVNPSSANINVFVDDLIGTSDRLKTSLTLRKNLSLVRDIVAPETFEQIGDTFLTRIFTPESASGFVDPVKLSQNLTKYRDVLKMWYGGEKLELLDKIAEVGAVQKQASKLAQNQTDSGTLVAWTAGGIAVRALTSAAASVAAGEIHPALGKSMVAASFITLSPPAIAKLYLSENGLKLLEQGSRVPANSAKAAELSTKILMIANGASSDLKKQRRKQSTQ